MMRPPLEIVGLFAGAPGALVEAPPEVLRCEVEIVEDLRAVLDGHVGDVDQAMGLGARGALALARRGLRLRWEDDLPPGERLPSAVDRMVALCDAGALGIYLPAACKVVAAGELDAMLGHLDRNETWWDLFVHRFAVIAESGIWMHTHGMEHFGYPDLECWASDEMVLHAERILAAGVEHLMRHGGDALWPGQIVEAVTADQAWARFSVRDAPAVEAHGYGPYGALELVLDEPVPEPAPPPAPSEPTPP
jgi:hypothetical protein